MASSVMSEDVPWSELPPEVIECVLSFLSVPVLCRFRTVCKGWNELLCAPRFHDLHEKNAQHRREVCFLRRFKVCHGYTAIDIPVQNTTCFLDMDEKRWYVITGSKTGYDTRAVAMDDCLVAEFWCENEQETWDNGNDVHNVFGVEMIDPISKLSFTLPPPFYGCPPDDVLPTLVLATDHAARNFKLFLMDNSGHVAFGLARFLRVFESSACTYAEPNCWRVASYPPNLKWEGVSNPPRTTERNSITRARSAVSFCGELYTILSPFASEACFLMKYECQNDTWSMILQDLPSKPPHLQLKPAHPQLLVSGNRLYMWFWRSVSPALNVRARVSAALEMVEVQIPHNASRIVFQITSATLERFFDESVDDLASVFPCITTDGICSSVVLVSGSTGKVIVYNVVSKSADILPAHSLEGSNLHVHRPPRQQPRMRYWASFKNLRLREVLPKRCRRYPPFPFSLRVQKDPLPDVESLFVLKFEEEELDDY